MKITHTLSMLGLLTLGANAAIVALTPGDINGGDTNTVSFSNGEITLTPLLNGAASTFNGNAVRLGMDVAGTSNNNAFSDPDTTAGNANDEQLQFGFDATSGLTLISWDFSRADGPGSNDGVFISGFTADPGAAITFGGAGTGTGTVSYSAGVVQLDITGADFGGDLDFVTFSNPGASAGQTLLLTVNDTTQAGAQFAIRGIEYQNAVVPEPSSTALLGLGGLALLIRRKR